MRYWSRLWIGGSLWLCLCGSLLGCSLCEALTIKLYLVRASFRDDVCLIVGVGVLAALKVEVDYHHLTDLKAVEVASLVSHE